ncbi:MAG: hypothetical protein HZA54_18715 [Planctomycetes bacterium]|nr:hypothetical protein [Planctomycetota bacterium]
MAMRCDPVRLTAELHAAGITPVALVGCRSGGPLDTLGWAAGHPTPVEEATAAHVLAAHDPERAERERRAAIARLRDHLAGWDAATPEQRCAGVKDLLAWVLRDEAAG